MKITILSVLLASTAFAPAVAWGQASGGTGAPTNSGGVGSVPTGTGGQSSSPAGQSVDPSAGDTGAAQEEVEISGPGGTAPAEDIVVTGSRIPNVQRRSAEVVSVLSTADIARTGEGDIAGALSRVTGLSLVGNGFVYVRGLGDRYSSSLLNGSPLPSPEPLRRVVPLDIFPTNVTASAVVQKTYSVNYPAEFGGGVINLTTRAVPDESFLQIGGSLGADTVTTSELGYVYDGGTRDWTGYDSGVRDVPGFIKDAGLGGLSVDTPNVITLNNAQTSLLLQNNQLPANYSYEASFGTSIDIGSVRFGVIGTGGLSNGWRTRSIRQQVATDADANIDSDFQTGLTDNRALVNGLLGFGAEFGDNRIRFTNLYIHDTLKQGRLARGFTGNVGPIGADPAAVGNPNVGVQPFIDQATRWFERELIDTQLVGEFKFGDVSFDARGAYAKTRRDSPYERSFRYEYAGGQIRDYVNRLSGLSGAELDFSELDERLYTGQANLSWAVPFDTPFNLSAGYFYSDTERSSSRFDFRFFGRNRQALTDGSEQLRPDFLLSDFNVQQNGITLVNESTAQGSAAYDASLKIHAGYAQVDGEITTGLRAQVGIRYETAKQRVLPLGAFVGTRLDNDYFLPAVTITYNLADDMQVRGHLSKTIARPQFRELAPQLYQDFESDRLFFGNPLLVDSELYNAELRYEWFFARDQRFGASGFYKHIDNPVEAVAFFGGGDRLQTGFANAPEATLYGGEAELQRFVPLSGLGNDFLASRRLVLIANYTYTKSELKVGGELIPDVFQSSAQVRTIAANALFRDGAALTGQSEHLVNLQVGLEDPSKLSQATVLFTYASNRATNRGPVQSGIRLPDLIERPGIRLDFVMRQGIKLPYIDKQIDLKFEARNLTGTGYREFQTFENGAQVDNNRYRLGRIFSLGASITL
ncbi:TonB-dependent receptor domain-containing protein [uncultured Sphingomonas sp.]|uniref:TonB-dependent receptor domain-containing protein n=1 Tax=uncultured Sphingomonas sp. TaxID=158754 RepID=UPI0035CB2A21